MQRKIQILMMILFGSPCVFHPYIFPNHKNTSSSTKKHYPYKYIKCYIILDDLDQKVMNIRHKT